MSRAPLHRETVSRNALRAVSDVIDVTRGCAVVAHG
jgi:hypothetical protein